MKNQNFWLLSGATSIFAGTSIYRPDILGWTDGLAIYLTLKAALAAIIIFSAFRMESASPITLAVAPPRPVAARMIADPLLSLRAFACCMVLFGHTFMVVFPVDGLQLRFQQHSLLWLLTASPWGGVWVFFTRSGYLMGKGFFSGRYTLDEHSIHQFLRNRALRILPIYYVAMLILSLLVYPEIFQPHNLWILFLISIFDYQGNLSINPVGALWSVSTEMQFYLLVPLLFLLLKFLVDKIGKGVLALPLVLLLISEGIKLALGNKFDVYQYLYTPLISNLDCFVMGMLGSPIVQALRGGRIAKWASIGKGTFLMAISYLVLAYVSSRVCFDGGKLTTFWEIAPGLVALAACGVIVLFELSPPVDRGGGMVGFLVRRTQWLGLLTYCIYAWHAPVLISLRRIAPDKLSLQESLVYGATAMLLALLLAAIFYYAVELPFDRKKKSSTELRYPDPATSSG